MKNSTISKILLTLAILTLFGLVFEWSASSWKFLDVISIILLSYIGLLLWGNKDKTKENRFSKIFHHQRFLFILTTTIWTVAFIIFGLTCYVNWYLPRGTMYPTGENTCDYSDGRPPGGCREIYKEDVSELSIPNWAKFFKENGINLFLVLCFVGVLMIAKQEYEEN